MPSRIGEPSKVCGFTREQLCAWIFSSMNREGNKCRQTMLSTPRKFFCHKSLFPKSELRPETVQSLRIASVVWYDQACPSKKESASRMPFLRANYFSVSYGIGRLRADFRPSNFFGKKIESLECILSGRWR